MRTYYRCDLNTGMHPTAAQAAPRNPSANPTARTCMNSHLRISSASFVSTVTCALLVSLVSGGPAHAEEPYVVWAKTSPWGYGPGSMAFTPQGEVLVLTYSFREEHRRLLKFDAQGRLVSSNLVSSLPGQMAVIQGIATDSTGATFLGGWGGPDGGNAFSVVKLNASGELAWVSRESTPLSGSPNYAAALAPDAQGNLWVLGVSQGPFTLGSFAFGDGHGPLLCKLDRDGQVLWAGRIEHQSTGGVYVYDLAVDSGSNVLISGWLAGGSADFGGTTVYPGAMLGNNWGDSFIAKYNPSGSLLWVRLSDLTEGRGGFTGMSIAVDRQNNTYYLASGLRFGKLDPNGGLLWEKEFSGAFLSYRQGIAVDATDQPVFTGEISGTVRFDDIVLISQATAWQDFFIAKADASGNIQWAMRGGGGPQARGYSVLCDKSGNIFLGAVIEGTTARFDGITLNLRPVVDGYPTVVLAKISPTPPLALTRSAQGADLTWAAKATNYVLEATTSLPAISWNPVTNSPTISGRDRKLQLPFTGAAKFFRLHKP